MTSWTDFVSLLFLNNDRPKQHTEQYPNIHSLHSPKGKAYKKKTESVLEDAGISV